MLSLRLQFEAVEVRCGSEAVSQSCDRRASEHSKEDSIELLLSRPSLVQFKY